jgi:hypothetical protein
VNRHDRPSARADQLLELRFVHVEGIGADVREDGLGPVQCKSIGRGDERERWHDHFVAGGELQEQRSHLQRVRARSCQQRFMDIQCLLEEVMALLGDRSVSGQLAGLDRPLDLSELRPERERSAERNRSICSEL